MRRDGFLARLPGAGKIVWEAFTEPDETITHEIRLMLSRRDMSIVVCSNDLIAIGVLKVLRQLGRRVPDDLSVVGFDDVPWAEIVTPALTTVRQPYTGLGAGAVDLLIKRIANPNRRYRRLKLAMSIVERESVANLAMPRKSPAERVAGAANGSISSRGSAERAVRAAQRARPLATEKS